MRLALVPTAEAASPIVAGEAADSVVDEEEDSEDTRLPFNHMLRVHLDRFSLGISSSYITQV